ncbi:MAG: rRNA maturation RNase YbeY [Bacilli bacterium]|jgi:probable rRNA maturation factor|nr:rRNA maturation RNase YbeY [Bacilli bacterium]MBR5750074.1 rRNA maturation RNase YbeY [Bacilli bacterium]MBR5990302.1 rRNA maturation RNase YbeY [Bacilli bacterium]
MEVVFDNPYGKEFDWLNERYSEIAKAAFSYLDVKENYEIDVSLVDDETIHQINRDYRNVDRVTDVISFAFNDDKDPNDQINSLEVQKMLGEILICLPQAKRQAAEIGNTLERELSFLFTHGLLHLLGYDHMTPEDEAIMFPLQEKILGLVGDKK